MHRSCYQFHWQPLSCSHSFGLGSCFHPVRALTNQSLNHSKYHHQCCWHSHSLLKTGQTWQYSCAAFALPRFPTQTWHWYHGLPSLLSFAIGSYSHSWKTWSIASCMTLVVLAHSYWVLLHMSSWWNCEPLVWKSSAVLEYSWNWIESQCTIFCTRQLQVSQTLTNGRTQPSSRSSLRWIGSLHSSSPHTGCLFLFSVLVWLSCKGAIQ